MAFMDLDDEIDSLVKKRGLSDDPEEARALADDDEIDDVEEEEEDDIEYSGTFDELMKNEDFQGEVKKMRDLAYAAGFISGTGSFAVALSSVRLTVRSTKNLDAVRVFGERVGVNVAEGLYGPKGNMKKGVLIQLSGKPLHRLMTQVWDLLPEDRKLEYARARKKARIYAETV